MDNDADLEGECNVIVHMKIYSNIVKLVYVQIASPVILNYNKPLFPSVFSF
jgi:hypothetical protein